MTLLETFNEINYQRPPYATEEELTELSYLLDELERVEIYLDSDSCTKTEEDECEAEIVSLTDRIDTLIQYV